MHKAYLRVYWTAALAQSREPSRRSSNSLTGDASHGWIQSASKHKEQEEFRGLMCSALATTQPPCLASIRLLAPVLAEGEAASSTQVAVVKTQERSRDSNEGKCDRPHIADTFVVCCRV